MDVEKKEKMFDAVKAACGIVGNYHDEVLRPIFDDVIEYLYDAGVPEKVMNSDRITGAVARGVSDLYFEQSGLSDYFKERAIQLALTEGE